MSFIDVTEENKEEYNAAVTHPLQSFEWGEFRKKTGITVVRRGNLDGKKINNAYTMTVHPVPKLPYAIGYLPKGPTPNIETIEDITNQAKKHKIVYVQLEPDVLASKGSFEMEQLNLTHGINIRPSFHPLFTKYTFVLNIDLSEDSLLANMHPKARYNIKVARKHGVKIVEDNSEKGFEEFLSLYKETTSRQRFYAHTPRYHKLMWEIFSSSKGKEDLGYHLLHAVLGDKTLTSWVLFSFHNKLYYPYGASSREHREVMASNLIMWESILLGKRLKLKEFDMWGALGPEPDTNDPWYGFHKFKQGYGATLTEFVGSYDLIINPAMYEIVKVGDKLRWALLKLKTRF